MAGMESADVSLGMLYEAALREARDDVIQEMDPDFYRAASEYLGRLRHERYDNVEAAVKRAVTSRATLMLSLLLEMRLEKAAGRRARRTGPGPTPAGGGAPPAAPGHPPASPAPAPPDGAPADAQDGPTAPPGPPAPRPPSPGRGNLLDEEKYILYPGTDMDERRSLVLDGIVSGRPRLLESVTAAHRTRLVMVRMLAPVDEMTGADMSRYGPYSAEDVATIPLENAAALVSQGTAARIGADRG